MVILSVVRDFFQLFRKAKRQTCPEQTVAVAGPRSFGETPRPPADDEGFLSAGTRRSGPTHQHQRRHRHADATAADPAFQSGYPFARRSDGHLGDRQRRQGRGHQERELPDGFRGRFEGRRQPTADDGVEEGRRYKAVVRQRGTDGEFLLKMMEVLLGCDFF